MADEILYRVENHVAHVTLNRPERHNALSIAMRGRWRDVLNEINRDPEVRCAVLSGAGDKAFCTGLDLKEVADRDAAGKKRVQTPALPPMPQKPMVAAIHGWCLAGGFEMSMMCDIRVASIASTFGLPEVKRCLIPAQAVNLLAGLIPRGEAAYLVLTGETIDAHKALAIGLLHKILPDREQTLAEALRIATAIAAGAPLAVQTAKKVLMANSGVATEFGYRMSLEALHRVQASEDAKEGIRAFTEKRPPRWTGR